MKQNKTTSWVLLIYKNKTYLAVATERKAMLFDAMLLRLLQFFRHFNSNVFFSISFKNIRKVIV
jgi:hypothetical protein